MNIPDAIKVIDPTRTDADRLRIGEKYKIGLAETDLLARTIAARVMRYAVDNAPRIEFHQGGERTAFCPTCDSDITEGGGSWEYCPFCGQAVKFPEDW